MECGAGLQWPDSALHYCYYENSCRFHISSDILSIRCCNILWRFTIENYVTNIFSDYRTGKKCCKPIFLVNIWTNYIFFLTYFDITKYLKAPFHRLQIRYKIIWQMIFSHLPFELYQTISTVKRDLGSVSQCLLNLQIVI